MHGAQLTIKPGADDVAGSKFTLQLRPVGSLYIVMLNPS